jgi:dCTP deaminase
MIINGKTLLLYAPIKDMLTSKQSEHGVTHGLGEAGYDIRIAETIHFKPNEFFSMVMDVRRDEEVQRNSRFVLASAMEEFVMPPTVVGVVHDKSTWARRGLSVFNTVIEPGWKGFLTLELVYHGNTELVIPRGAGIAQVVFHHTEHGAQYTGRYQDQPRGPVAAKDSTP